MSGLWALNFYGLIPEKVALFSSVTTRVTRSFQNSFGLFSYSSLKRDFFWGFTPRQIQREQIWIADPEKALLDLWHLRRGEWTADRLQEMRFQNFAAVDMGKLKDFAARWGAPRLCRAASRYQELARAEQVGTVIR